MCKKIGLIMMAVMMILTMNCKAKAVSYGDVTRLTSQELNLYSKHPWMALKAKNAATDAENAACKYWQKYTLYQGNGDAFRHGYWSALLTKRIGRDWAYEIGLAHEGLSKSYQFNKQEDDTKMDISNNYLGRVDGDKYINYTDEVIRDIIIIHVKNGNYKRIREYSSKNTGTANKFNGVYTRYRGYYIKTTKGGCTK